MSSPRYTARFSTAAHLCRATASQEKEIRASIDRLKGLLPADIDPEEHPTLLYVVGNLFVAGLLNKNDDGVSVEDGLKMYKAFEGQQINIEHNRSSVVGFIVKAGLSEFGTDRLITEDEARAAGKPYNVAIAIALWKVVDKDLIRFILDSTESESSMKDNLSLSFEVGFDDYKIVTLPRNVTNLAMATKIVTSDADDFDQFDKKLRANGGSGKNGSEHVGRVIEWPIIPLGGGIVAMPAAQVKGITPVLSLPDSVEQEADTTEAGANTKVKYKYSSAQCTLGEQDSAAFLSYSANIPSELLYTEEEGYGRENEPHITAYYGINGNDVTPVQISVNGCGPIRAKLGAITAFVNEDKPYDVLKVDVDSEDLHRLYALIKASCDCDELRPVYYPHLTLAYLKKGMSAQYVGDKRFTGMELTFNSLTFSPADGSRVEIPLVNPASIVSDLTVSVQTAAQQVYSELDSHDIMASTPTRFIKLSAGWQDRLASIQAQAGGNPLVNGVTVILSDGRKLENVKIFDGETLELEKELAFNGVIITDMTPGVAAPNYINPNKVDVYPIASEEATKKQEALEEKRKETIIAPYADASIKAACAILDTLCINHAAASVSTNTLTSPSDIINNNITKPMKLEDLKEAIAAVKSVEDLPAVVANVASFADAIAKASEEQVAARKLAEDSAKAAQVSLEEVKAQLSDLTKSYNEMIAAQQAAAAEAAFQSRMAAVEEIFAFDDEARADVNEEIKACANDEAFAKWMARAKRMYKGFMKKKDAKASDDMDEDEKKDGEMKEKECEAASKTALASAKDNITDASIHNSVDASVAKESIVELYKKTALKHIRIGGETAEELTAKAKATVKKTR